MGDDCRLTCSFYQSLSCDTSIRKALQNTVCIQAFNRERDGDGLVCPVSKIGKKCPDFAKKWPDCGHL